MRRTLALCRSGLAAAAAAVLLTACGGSDGNTTASETTSSSSTSSAAETPENTAPQADSEFCTDAAALQERVTAGFSGQDQSNISELLRAAAQEWRGIEPPSDIAADWAVFGDALEEFAAISQIDFNDPQAVAQWQQQITQLQTEYGEPIGRVQSYLATECGLTEDGATESASPSS